MESSPMIGENHHQLCQRMVSLSTTRPCVMVQGGSQVLLTPVSLATGDGQPPSLAREGMVVELS